MPPALLVVHPGALGDVVLVFGLIAELRRHFAPVALMARSEVARLAVEEGLADEALALESAWTAALFSGRPEPRALSRLAPYSHALAFARSPELADGLRAIARAGVCAVSPRPEPGLRLHAADHAWSAVKACGLLPADAVPRLPPRRASAPAHGAAVLIHPGAGSPRKRWPIERFRAVAAAVESEGGRVEYVLGPADGDLRPRLADAAAVHSTAGHPGAAPAAGLRPGLRRQRLRGQPPGGLAGSALRRGVRAERPRALAAARGKRRSRPAAPRVRALLRNRLRELRTPRLHPGGLARGRPAGLEARDG